MALSGTSRRAGRKPSPNAAAVSGRRAELLTRAAFFLSLVLVILRMTMQEIFRGDALPAPGGTSPPAMPGPASGMLLDLLCCLPALCVLARSVIDPTFSLRRRWSFGALFAMAVWTPASVFWADDKFAAIVQGSHWAAALVLLWSTAQLVRDWLRLRVVAAAGFGVLLVLLTQGYYYRFVDLPDLQREWRSNQARWLQDRNVAPDSLEATQIGKNVESGDVTGFSLSRNTYAAVLVLLVMVSGGILMQRARDGDGYLWTAPVAIAVVVALWMLYRYVQSKTAFATPVVGAALCVLFWRRGKWFAPRAARLYWASVGAAALATVAVIGHGLKHGTLLHVSLTFRWQYWVGAARLFARHPLLGVGWGNFGPRYLAYRMWQAAEEPSDPHNFLIRSFVELGSVGGVLMLAWVLRTAWELTVEPARESAPAPVRSDVGHPGRSPVRVLTALAMVAMTASAAVSIDWGQQGSWIFIECFKRALFGISLFVGLFLVAVRSLDRQELDDRPAPHLLTAVRIGLALFLAHNLIDFSLFETGPMFLFALLTGAAMGIRSADAVGRPMGSRRLRVGLFAGAGTGWLVAAVAWGSTVARADAFAAEGEEQVRGNHLDAAQASFVEAFRAVPINGDYAFRAEQVGLMRRGNPAESRGLIDEAIDADPSSVRYRLARAILSVSAGDLPTARADYEQILRLDPNNRELRLQYAGLLEKIGDRPAALLQYRMTLQLNRALAPDEIRRLSPAQVARVNQRIDAITRVAP